MQQKYVEMASLQNKNKDEFFFLVISRRVLFSSVADPGSGKGLFRIPNPYFLELSDKFLGKKVL
jgi:hypothetical protein